MTSGFLTRFLQPIQQLGFGGFAPRQAGFGGFVFGRILAGLRPAHLFVIHTIISFGYGSALHKASAQEDL